MRIAITNPTTWPQVRRGAERFINELAAFLANRGHEVTVIAAKPGRREVRKERGYTTVCHRRLWHPVLARAGVLEVHAFMITAFASLMRKRYDVVHCCTFTGAFAARQARRFTNVPYVFLVNGLPPRIKYFRSVTLKGAVFRRAVTDADEVISLGDYMREYFQTRFGRGGIVLPIPVDMNRFPLSTTRDHDRPVILCAAALDDERKGGKLLMRAFDRLKTINPNVRLQISCKLTESQRDTLLGEVSSAWRRDVEFLGVGQLDDLPTLFGRAAVSVLPSLWEAFGMVIPESMATGTPVVGTRDGNIPALINNEKVGRLFDPGHSTTPQPTNLEGLVEALRQGLELSRMPETAQCCRDHAEQYSWNQVGPRFEQLYIDLIDKRRR